MLTIRSIATRIDAVLPYYIIQGWGQQILGVCFSTVEKGAPWSCVWKSCATFLIWLEVWSTSDLFWCIMKTHERWRALPCRALFVSILAWNSFKHSLHIMVWHHMTLWRHGVTSCDVVTSQRDIRWHNYYLMRVNEVNPYAWEARKITSSVGKVVAMQHIWLIKYENNSDGTYWKPTENSFI